MEMSTELNVILAYAFGLILLYIVGYVLLIPIKWVLKLIYNGIIGGVVLIVINLLGSFWGIGIAINPVTALIVGFLGIPGVVLMFVLQNLL